MRTARMSYDPTNVAERPFIGFNLPADQLQALDRARLDLRLSRSEFSRRAIDAYLRQLQFAAN